MTETETAKKVLQEYYGYESEDDVASGLATVLENWKDTCVNQKVEEIRETLRQTDRIVVRDEVCIPETKWFELVRKVSGE